MTTTTTSIAPGRELTADQVAEDLARRILRLLPDDTAPLRLDAGSLDVPPSRGRTTVGEGRAYTVRTISGGFVLARTPGGVGPCPACLDTRWLTCRSEQERHLAEDPQRVTTTPARPAGAHVVTTLAAILAADARRPVEERAWTPVWQLATVGATISRWSLLKDSACPECRTPTQDTPEAARIELAPTPVPTGAVRAARPEDLTLPLDALANPLCGALGPVSMRAYHATATAPTSGQFLVRSKYGLHQMWWSGHAESYARSELQGLLEGLERTAGQRPSAKAETPRATVWEIDAPVVEVEQCGRYSDDFYARHGDKYVPWEDNPSIPWVWGWSLRDRRAVAVPEQLAYYLDHRTDHRNTVQECSNGCASGSSLVEATLHGLLELIERDAFLTSWYAALTPPEIDLDSVADPLVQHMRGQVDLLGYDLRTFDVRTDLPVPAVGAVAVRRDGGFGRLCFAGGAGLDPVDAVRAAVCEVASYVPGFADRVRDRREFLEAAVTDFRLVTELEHHALLYGMPEMERFARHWLDQARPLPLSVVYQAWHDAYAPATDLADAVRRLVSLFADRGMDTVVVDQTSPEQSALGVHTVATIVPGLVPIDFGWERQRCLRMPRTRLAHYHAGRTPRPLVTLLPAPHPFP